MMTVSSRRIFSESSATKLKTSRISFVCCDSELKRLQNRMTRTIMKYVEPNVFKKVKQTSIINGVVLTTENTLWVEYR